MSANQRLPDPNGTDVKFSGVRKCKCGTVVGVAACGVFRPNPHFGTISKQGNYLCDECLISLRAKKGAKVASRS